MARLYEKFVAEWLCKNSPNDWHVDPQQKVDIDENGKLSFNIDIVITDVKTGATKFVLDTKYKKPDYPSPDDIEKISTYADLKNCEKAFLIYPVDLSESLNAHIGKKNIKNLTFSIDSNLEEAGIKFLNELISYQ